MLPFEMVVWVLAMLLASHDAPAAAPRKADFARDVRPILERRCQPCHFEGGKMHAQLPFDQAATVDQLGTRLFSRIKKDDEQAVIRQFLERAAD